MANEKSVDRLTTWQSEWDNDQIGFHNPNVHKSLIKNFHLLESDGKPNKVFVPLCGKSVDMKWLMDRGVTVVGIDGVLKALHDFFKENNLEWTEEEVPAMGPGCRLLKSKDGKIRLYFGDMMLFNESVEGKFDAVWDRGSIVALNREDIPRYSEIMKSVVSEKGKILVEVMEYDVAIFDDGVNPPVIPPPFPMFEDEMKKLFEPEYTIKALETSRIPIMDKEIGTKSYIISRA